MYISDWYINFDETYIAYSQLYNCKGFTNYAVPNSIHHELIYGVCGAGPCHYRQQQLFDLIFDNAFSCLFQIIMMSVNRHNMCPTNTYVSIRTV